MFIEYEFIYNNGEVKTFLCGGLELKKFIESGVSGFLIGYHLGKYVYTRIVINGVVFMD